MVLNVAHACHGESLYFRIRTHNVKLIRKRYRTRQRRVSLVASIIYLINMRINAFQLGMYAILTLWVQAISWFGY